MTKNNLKLNAGLSWSSGRRRLGDLVGWELNPRQADEKHVARLVESHEEFAQIETLAIGPNNEIYNGHQRLQAWLTRYGEDHQVDVRISSRPLTEQERKKLVIFLHASTVGEWDFEKLQGFDLDELLDWGFENVGDYFDSRKQPKISVAHNAGADSVAHRRLFRAVFYVEDVRTLEAALLATGVRNRAAAFAEICQFYIENAKGQYNASSQGFAETEAVGFDT